MVSWWIGAGVVVAALSSVVLAVSAAAIAFVALRRYLGGPEYRPNVHLDRVEADRERERFRERLRAYREIMNAIVALNRVAMGMSDGEFQDEADHLSLEDDDSAFEEPHDDVTEAYQSNYHIIDAEVKTAVTEYVDYLATYHAEGAQKGELLSLSGSVAEAMRSSIGVESLFEERTDS